ncbi:hypothetical protein G7Z17_g9878 [Cylindrodendrum hubeiense]|uniref:Uncharacterized protein n=1 Tax=Cylindrodendrum hubeiense TaxID=595255 RepID=A0A9P5H350_9HYPO|nr:hypothetical protein G7Z17_g9878 [Cylindrodendrum hubeiense]
MAEFVEFYVTCNPPLLAAGVASVVAHKHVLEILYEPEVPWFKIITARESQEEVATLIQSYLEQRLEEETDLVDEDQPEVVDTIGDDLNPRADVDIVVEDPQVIPWSLYQQNQRANAKDYDEYRFPTHLENLPFKTVWRGLESFDGLSISDLLSRFDFLWPNPVSTSGLQRLEEHVNCQIAHNMKGDLVYIGSDKAMECLGDAVRKLENLLALHKSLVPNSTHLVFTEDGMIMNLGFRYLTHMGFDKLTYLNNCVSGTRIKNRPLNGAATLRVKKQNARGDLELDKTVYPTGPEPSDPFRSSFGAFTDFNYRPKTPGSMPTKASKQLMPGPTSEQTATPSEKKPDIYSESSVSTSVRIRGPVYAGNSPEIKYRGSATSRSAHGESPSKIDHEQYKVSVGATQQHEMIHLDEDIVLRLNDTTRPSSVASQRDPLAAVDPVASWIAGIEAAGFDPPLDGVTELAPLGDVPDMTNSVTSFRGDFLISLDPDTESKPDSPPGLTHGMFALMNLLPQYGNETAPHTIPPHVPQTIGMNEDHLLDNPEAHIYYSALMDMFDEGNAVTSLSDIPENTQEAGRDDQDTREGDLGKLLCKKKSKEKELFFTMRQKAAPNQTWARVASKSKMPMKLVHSIAKEVQQLRRGRRVIGDVEMKVNALLKILQITPGQIGLKAKLGRICINDLEGSWVSLEEGPSIRARQVFDFSDETIDFHTILTTNGAEADLMPLMKLSKGPWALYDKQVYYDIVCRSRDNDDLIVVEVDAFTFEHVCRSPSQELPGVYIHCAQRAWDIQLSVSRMGFDEVPEDFGQFASSLVNSLGISTDDDGQVAIEAKPDNASRWYIEGVSIRHIAKYRVGPKSPNYLAITMTRIVQRTGRSNYQGVTTPAPIPGKGSLTQWFEASIGSTRADRLLKQNIGLEFGDKTLWTPGQFEKEGIVKALCNPALKMVTQMDQIGRTNSNSERLKVGRGTRTVPNSDNAFVFW